MKNYASIVLLFVIIAVLLVGYDAGKKYAIEKMELYTVTRYNPEAPEESRWREYDQMVYVELDGVTYEKGMTQC